MVKQYSLKDISIITLKRITIDDDLREFIEKVNFNFDQILSVLDNRFYDEVSKNVLKLIASGKYLQYLTNKSSDSIQWIGKPGKTGIPKAGEPGKDGHSIYVSKTEIPQDGTVDNIIYKEGDVVLDKSGNVYVITKKDDKLYYTLQFKLSSKSDNTGSNSNTTNGIITTEANYIAASDDIPNHWLLYGINNNSIPDGSNNVILATANETNAQLYYLTLGAEKAISKNSGTLNLVNIPKSDIQRSVDETFSPQILLKYRKNSQSSLYSKDISAHIRYFDVYDSALEHVKYQQLDMRTSANTGVSIQSFADNSKENAVILNARKIRFVGNRGVVPAVFEEGEPELIVRVHKKGNQSTSDTHYDLSSYNQSYVAIYTNENLLINATKDLALSAQNIRLDGETDINGTLHVDNIEHTIRSRKIVIGGKLHVNDTSLLLDNDYELITNKISNGNNITITTPTVDFSNTVSIGEQLKVNVISPKSGQAVSISQVSITLNSTIAGKTIYHAGNLNLLSTPFSAQQYNATSAGYSIDSKKIIFVVENALTIGNSTLNNINVTSKNGLSVNNDKVITEFVFDKFIKQNTKNLEGKVDTEDLVLNVADIQGIPSGYSLGRTSSTIDYQSFGFPTVKKTGYEGYFLGANYQWIETQVIPFLRNSSSKVEKGVLGFLDKNELQYLSLEQLLDANSHKVADDKHIQVVNVNREGKLQITNVLQIVDPVDKTKEDLILSYDKDSQSAIWKENNPLPKENKNPGRILILNKDSQPEWGNYDYMHYRFFWNTKTNKLDRIDPSNIDWNKWIDMEGFGDTRNDPSNIFSGASIVGEFDYSNYIGNRTKIYNGNPKLEFESFGLPKDISENAVDLEIIKQHAPQGSFHGTSNNHGTSASNYFYKADQIIPSLRYVVSVIGNVVTVYFWKPYRQTDLESYEFYNQRNYNGSVSDNILINDACESTKMHIPNYLANYDNHGITFGTYGFIDGYNRNKNTIEFPTSFDKHLDLYLNCIPFDVWFRYNIAYDLSTLPNNDGLSDGIIEKLTRLLQNKEFNDNNKIVTLGLEAIHQAGIGKNFYFKNFGTLNQISWTLSNPISKEHYNF